MIAIVFLLGLLAVTLFAAATTGQALPVSEILMLTGIFVVFFGSGVYIAAVLGVLGVLTGFFFTDRGRGECGHHPKQRDAANARDGPAVAQQAFDGSIGMR